jgi:glycerophosphoryl diester phosphodiesterase
VGVIWLGSTDIARASAEGLGWIGPEAGHVTSTVCAAAHAAGWLPVDVPR